MKCSKIPILTLIKLSIGSKAFVDLKNSVFSPAGAVKISFFHAFASLLLNIYIHIHIHRMWIPINHPETKTSANPNPQVPSQNSQNFQNSSTYEYLANGYTSRSKSANSPHFCHHFMCLQIQIRHAFVIYSILLMILQF